MLDRYTLAAGLGILWLANTSSAGESTGKVPRLTTAQPVPLIAAADVGGPASLPAGYVLLYEQNFVEADALREFALADPQAWRLGSSQRGRALELVAQSRYEPPVRSPVNLAMIKDRVFGDFVLECDLMQTGREYGHRDMCLFFGFESPARFYYVHLATAADDHAHNVFIVNNQPRTKIGRQTTKGVDWGHQTWHRVRLERTVSDGWVKVYFDDSEKPIMSAQDRTLGAGYIGFGSFDDTGMIGNIRIWGPSGERRPGPVFSQPDP